MAIGLAANYGRKFLMQGMEAAAGDWDDILAAEHELALGIFDKMLATDDTQTWKRSMLLMKLTHALDKHAHQEEMVVYPALRALVSKHAHMEEEEVFPRFKQDLTEAQNKKITGLVNADGFWMA
jgi:hemerythrin superfamily protein